MDYTPTLLDNGIKWVTRAPRKISSASNLIKIFDETSWFLTLISMVSIGLSLLLAYKVGSCYGLENRDSVITLLTPLAILSAESFPEECMNNAKSNHLFSKLSPTALLSSIKYSNP